MALQRRTKKDKIDTNPERVQNPYESLKRSPGKFDQRVFTEQDLYGANVMRFYNRLYDTQQNLQIHRYDKKIGELKKRSVELKVQREEYAYLNALRNALRKEKHKRDSGLSPQISQVAFEQTRPRVHQVKSATVTHNKEENVTDKQHEVKNQKTGDNVSITELNEGEDEDDEEATEISDSTENNNKEQKSKKMKRTVTPSRMSTLENLSFEIMTHTLPITKLKRVMPPEELPVQEKWPILSNYRKKKMLPSVIEGKQKLEEDMNDLHKKLNDYFHCDNFPLWQYKYIPKEHARKYRLLKAIETEGIILPTIPK